MKIRCAQALALLLALSGCGTTAVRPPPKIPPPVAWAQQPEELGKLRTGKVVAIDRASFEDNSTYGARTVSVMVPIRGGFIPLELPSTSSKSRVTQEYFRYTIQRSKSKELEVWEDFVEYSLGACLAARDQPQLIVPALAQECAEQ